MLVIPFTSGDKYVSERGQPTTDLFHGKDIADTVPSVVRIDMAPGGISKAHLHERMWVIPIVYSGAAVTLYGDRLQYRQETGDGEAVAIAPGVPHVAVNLSSTEPVRAIEIRTSRQCGDDIVLLPELDELAAEAVRLIRQPVTVLV